MATLFLLALSIGILPLVVSYALLSPSPQRTGPAIPDGSVLLCALAFNITFLWQELWPVIPKALTPGLHPILYHNHHSWTGHAPVEELLQGTGAVATLASGVLAAFGLTVAQRASPAPRPS